MENPESAWRILSAISADDRNGPSRSAGAAYIALSACAAAVLPGASPVAAPGSHKTAAARRVGPKFVVTRGDRTAGVVSRRRAIPVPQPNRGPGRGDRVDGARSSAALALQSALLR